MSIIHTSQIKNVGIHSFSEIDIHINAHDAEHGHASATLRIEAHGFASTVHLDPKSLRKIAFALAAAAHAVEQSALVKSDGGEIEGRKLMDAQDVAAEVRA